MSLVGPRFGFGNDNKQQADSSTSRVQQQQSSFSGRVVLPAPVPMADLGWNPYRNEERKAAAALFMLD